MDRRSFLKAAAGVAAAAALPLPEEELVPVEVFVVDSLTGVDDVQTAGRATQLLPKKTAADLKESLDGFIAKKQAQMMRAFELQTVSNFTLLEAMGYAQYDLCLQQRIMADCGIPKVLLHPTLGENDETPTIPAESFSDSDRGGIADLSLIQRAILFA